MARDLERESSPVRRLVVTPHDASISEQSDVEQYMTLMARGARKIVATAQSRGHSLVERKVEQLLELVSEGCTQEFHRCFESRSWPAEKTLEMFVSWGIQESVEEARAHLSPNNFEEDRAYFS